MTLQKMSKLVWPSLFFSSGIPIMHMLVLIVTHRFPTWFIFHSHFCSSDCVICIDLSLSSLILPSAFKFAVVPLMKLSL
uniref:PRO1410 n=1 Tax=Homo sapiens TaxID=9606 RepID=Q9P1H6_HUMAN|nr:PRO1410 [Homo sapiens]